MQPVVSIKTALQEGRSVPRSPVALYRGLLVNAGMLACRSAASIAPITAVQFAANRVLETALNPGDGELSHASRIVTAGGAGVASALLSCPAELLMIQQQRSGGSLRVEAHKVLSQHGAGRLMAGLSMTAVRESVYTAGYLGLMPVLSEILSGHPAMQQFPAGTPLLLSGLTAGLAAALLTQPADTAKTRMQAFLNHDTHPQYRTAVSTLRFIASTQGIGSLWAGIAPRAFRIVGATFILNGVRTQLTDLLEGSRDKVEGAQQLPIIDIGAGGGTQ
ncbi:hypothetical protein WJX72_011293 [[Myrmecia] bisecta]|uniref:Uncharacterized protein n=1 Tax=[Myrmecia] bisecta TaxID=41462 RepID=A0AAW1QTR5_9CHLO